MTAERLGQVDDADGGRHAEVCGAVRAAAYLVHGVVGGGERGTGPREERGARVGQWSNPLRSRC
ncbi:hypothetical protein ACIBP6_02865 [Nonomuraea terrae]|uniref:hypothetical protein n=1 Tax=Nonomuraea terrae TaxID=2530383 RepID=UPI0037B1F734